jgi:inosine-uridine nucleoside N-ribohydrolase
VQSAAATDLIERALATKEGKLNVLAIAAITNVASALLIEPKIAEKIVVVWLGGNAPYWPHTNEFNLAQDMSGARVLLDMDVPLILLPCRPVASHLAVTAPELDHYLAPYSKLGAYLSDIVRDYIKRHRWDTIAAEAGSKVIWDISASAWAINPKWVELEDQPSPVLRDDVTWDPAPKNRRTIQIARQLDRDAIFADFYAKARRTK